jgi:hypothetical protein
MVTLVPAGPFYLTADNETGFTMRYASDAIYGDVLLMDSVLHDCYEWDDYGHASNSTMYQSYWEPGQGQMGVEFSGSIADPLTPEGFTPSVDWDVWILVNNSNPSAPTYTMTGWGDCFPAWEAYIGGQQIFGYTPPAYDITTIAMCLLGYNQIDFSANGPIQTQ